MRALLKDNIVDVFVWVDDILPKRVKPGAVSILKNSELITILIWDGLTESHQNLREIYDWITREYRDYFPKLPAYQNFVSHCHRVAGILAWLLQTTLSTEAPLRFADSTMLPVCKLVRADRHKVAREYAAFGKNHQGWHYGFKLHVSIDRRSRFSSIYFTPANESDVLQLKYLVNELTDIVVADAGYTARVTREHIWRDFHCLVISPPRPKQVWIMAKWQQLLLELRPKIEAVFGNLKEKRHLVTSYPRSIRGYFVHYLRVLLGYQMEVANS